MKGIDSLLFAFAGASISEPFDEWVVIDFQLGNLCKWIYLEIEFKNKRMVVYLFILVGGNCDEFRLFEDISAERAVR